jgi:urease accessory protein
MTTHWSPRPDEDVSIVSRDARGGRFDLAFFRHGARTVIGHQFVSYPFHLTRPFALDTHIPSLLTVYQQSSSGGVYRAERLGCRYELGAEAAAHVTTQAATIVHHCYGETARQSVEIELGRNAFFALTPDPLVLFPGASFCGRIDARLCEGAALLLGDSFALHDPTGHARPFDALRSQITVRDQDGALLVRDSSRVDGKSLVGPSSPIGGWQVVSSYLLLGDPARMPSREDLGQIAGDEPAAIGVSALPNRAGWGVRCLAANAVAARRIGDSIFSICVRSALGHTPTVRRK